MKEKVARIQKIPHLLSSHLPSPLSLRARCAFLHARRTPAFTCACSATCALLPPAHTADAALATLPLPYLPRRVAHTYCRLTHACAPTSCARSAQRRWHTAARRAVALRASPSYSMRSCRAALTPCCNAHHRFRSCAGARISLVLLLFLILPASHLPPQTFPATPLPSLYLPPSLSLLRHLSSLACLSPHSIPAIFLPLPILSPLLPSRRHGLV